MLGAESLRDLPEAYNLGSSTIPRTPRPGVNNICPVPCTRCCISSLTTVRITWRASAGPTLGGSDSVDL